METRFSNSPSATERTMPGNKGSTGESGMLLIPHGMTIYRSERGFHQRITDPRAPILGSGAGTSIRFPPVQEGARRIQASPFENLEEMMLSESGALFYSADSE